MREISFRGKRKDNGAWVEGYLCHKYFAEMPHDRLVIQYIPQANAYKWTPEYMAVEIDPETVGQWTGLTDTKGKKIFEGDIVRAIYQSNYIGIENTDFGIGVVKYLGSYYSGASYHIDIIGEMGSRVFSASLENGVTVVGNIHDNPELLYKQ